MLRNIVAAALALACACGGAGGAPQAWHLDAIRADPGRALGTGLGIVIALVDTGFTSLPMPGLAGRLLNPGSGDPNGHGTAMAVIAAGGGDLGVWGVAPAAHGPILVRVSSVRVRPWLSRAILLVCEF